jgi:hypothetical protein
MSPFSNTNLKVPHGDSDKGKFNKWNHELMLNDKPSHRGKIRPYARREEIVLDRLEN